MALIPMVCFMLGAMFIGITSANLIDIGEDAPPCYPLFNPRPNCTIHQVEGWVYWSNMQYKYFPKPLSKLDAEDFCDPWDEEVCLGEDQSSRYRAQLGSFAVEGEVENALLEAYRQACIKQDTHFWLGAYKTRYGKLRYTDRVSTERNTFPSRSVPTLTEGSDCVAMSARTGEMVVKRCSEALPFVCKIQPAGH